MGARLRGRTAAAQSRKGSEKGFGKGSGERFWGRVLRRGPAIDFTVRTEGVLRRGFQKVPRTSPRRARPLRRPFLQNTCGDFPCIAIPLACYRIGFGLRPETGKE